MFLSKDRFQIEEEGLGVIGIINLIVSWQLFNRNVILLIIKSLIGN